MTESELHELMKRKMSPVLGTRIEDSIGNGVFDSNWTWHGHDVWVDYKIFGSGCRKDCFKIKGSQVRWALDRFKAGSTNAYFLAAHKTDSKRKYTLHVFWAWMACKEAWESRPRGSDKAILFQYSEERDLLRHVLAADKWSEVRALLTPQ